MGSLASHWKAGYRIPKPICSALYSQLGLPRWLSGKKCACQCRRHRRCRFDSWARKVPWRREMATHSSVSAWRIPWTEEPGGLQSMGLQNSGHDRTHMWAGGGGWLQLLYLTWGVVKTRSWVLHPPTPCPKNTEEEGRNTRVTEPWFCSRLTTDKHGTGPPIKHPKQKSVKEKAHDCLGKSTFIKNASEDFSTPIKPPQLKKAQQIYVLWVGPDSGPLLDQKILKKQWFKGTTEINSLQQKTLRWKLFFFFFLDEENGAQRSTLLKLTQLPCDYNGLLALLHIMRHSSFRSQDCCYFLLNCPEWIHQHTYT